MWMLQSRFKRIVKQVIQLIILFLVSSLLVLSPIVSLQSFAQGLFPENFGDAGAAVVVDGIPLFYLHNLENFNARNRVQFTNKFLAKAIATEQTIIFDVRQDESTNATFLSLNNNYLLTVNVKDTLLGFSITQQANQWKTILEKAISKAQKERTLKYIGKRSLWILMAIAVLIIIQFLLRIASRIFKFKTGIFTKLLWGFGCGTITIFISEWFPALRSLRYQLFIPFSQPQWLGLFGALSISLIFSYYSIDLIQFILKRVDPQALEKIYNKIFHPYDRLLKFSVLSISINWSLTLLEPLVPVIYNLLKPIINLCLIASLCWLCVKLTSRYLRTYGFKIGRSFTSSNDDAILVFETIINILIFIAALVAFASSLNFDLIGLVASLGLVGLAVAFAAQKILEQLIATLVLYLDRPFVTGDYIRLSGGELGKVESIGLRSSKVRSLGTGTIIVIPNSILVSVEIENVSLAKKIMVLLYMNFEKILEEREYALVQQVIMEKTAYLSGIDTNSTHIYQADGTGKKLRVNFVILGSQDNAIEVRKRLLELASAEIAKSLSVHGIMFTIEDPTIYVQTPVTI